MDLTVIGKTVAALRKERGIKQDALAGAVGVSSQAVSKWENGGAPDVELLPAIADFFGVSIDALFGRATAAPSADAGQVIEAALSAVPPEERFEEAFALCWLIERALYGCYTPAALRPAEYRTVWEPADEEDPARPLHSAVETAEGVSRMALRPRRSFFLAPAPLVPDDTPAPYAALFRALSDDDLLRTLLHLVRRAPQTAFTTAQLAQETGQSAERTEAALEALLAHRLVKRTDDAYALRSASAVSALLLFAGELLDPPTRFCCHVNRL